MYAGPIFYAQFILLKYNTLMMEDFSTRSAYPDADMHAAIQSIAPLRDWLLIETFCFYAYLHATVFFIAGHQIKSWCYKKHDTETDIKKTETDFILYSRDSLVWFSYNFLNVFMPIIIVTLATRRSTLEVCPSSILQCEAFDQNEKTFTYILLGLAASQLLHMILNVRLY